MRALLTRSWPAGAVVRGNRIVALATNADTIAETTGPTQAAIGVSDAMGATVAGQMCDVHLVGAVEVVAGGNIARGDWLISDAQGRAVPLPAPAVAAQTREVVGRALGAAAEGDLLFVLLGPTRVVVPVA